MAKWTPEQRAKFRATMRAKRTDGVLRRAKTTQPPPTTRRTRYDVRVLSHTDDGLASVHYSILAWGELADLLYLKYQNSTIDEIHVVRK